MSAIGTFIIVCYTVLLLGVVSAVTVAIPTRILKLIVGVPAFAWVCWLAYAPYKEEQEIRERYTELCKGAGVKIVRKVGVEGFYDDTMPNGLGVVSPQGAAYYEEQGFRFYEYRFGRNARGGQVSNAEFRVVHYEKQGGV